MGPVWIIVGQVSAMRPAIANHIRITISNVELVPLRSWLPLVAQKRRTWFTPAVSPQPAELTGGAAFRTVDLGSCRVRLRSLRADRR